MERLSLRGQPRLWFPKPSSFGKKKDAAMVAEPPDVPGRVDRTAARIQNNRVVAIRGLRRKIDAVRRGHGQPPLTLREIAAHPEFPYTYDTLSKCLRGVQWMSSHVFAATINALTALEESARQGSPPRPQ